MSVPALTPSQTVGPFFAPALLRPDAPGNVLVRAETAGERIRIEGHLYDGERAPVPDALIEIWQANSEGRYRHPADGRAGPLDPAFSGFGRCGTDSEGRFWFETVRPGPVPFAGGRLQAPHTCVTVHARGLLNHLVTRLYFADEPANAADAVLACVSASRRTTLLAARDPGAGIAVYRWAIILQGEGETAFLNV